MSTPLCHYFKHFVVAIFWSDEMVKRERLLLESDYKPCVQSAIEEAGKIRVRIEVEVMHPYQKEYLKARLVCLNYHIEQVSFALPLIQISR
jgi:hypothetical protein